MPFLTTEQGYYSMAGGTVRTENGKDNQRTSMAKDPEIIHLEGRVGRVEDDVRDIKAGVNKLLDRPQSPGFAQVIGTLVSTLVACSLLFGFAQWSLAQAVMPLKAEVEQVQLKAVWAADSLHAARVQAAVLEERLNWVKELASRPR